MPFRQREVGQLKNPISLMILKGQGSRRGKGTPANRLPPSLEIPRMQLNMTLSNMLQSEAGSNFKVGPPWTRELQGLLQTSIILWVMALKLDSVWGFCCISLLPNEVTCLVSALEGRSSLGLGYQTSCYESSWWWCPFSPAFANKMLSDYSQPCGTQSCRQFVTSTAFTAVVRVAEV